MSEEDLDALELKLLMCKYVYYGLDQSPISDFEYDQLERMYLGHRPGPEHWVGFDHRHPRAGEAIELADREGFKSFE